MFGFVILLLLVEFFDSYRIIYLIGAIFTIAFDVLIIVGNNSNRNNKEHNNKKYKYKPNPKYETGIKYNDVSLEIMHYDSSIIKYNIEQSKEHFKEDYKVLDRKFN